LRRRWHEEMQFGTIELIAEMLQHDGMTDMYSAGRVYHTTESQKGGYTSFSSTLSRPIQPEISSCSPVFVQNLLTNSSRIRQEAFMEITSTHSQSLQSRQMAGACKQKYKIPVRRDTIKRESFRKTFLGACVRGRKQKMNMTLITCSLPMPKGIPPRSHQHQNQMQTPHHLTHTPLLTPASQHPYSPP
jgi:hypothetical protein